MLRGLYTIPLGRSSGATRFPSGLLRVESPPWDDVRELLFEATIDAVDAVRMEAKLEGDLLENHILRFTVGVYLSFVRIRCPVVVVDDVGTHAVHEEFEFHPELLAVHVRRSCFRFFHLEVVEIQLPADNLHEVFPKRMRVVLAVFPFWPVLLAPVNLPEHPEVRLLIELQVVRRPTLFSNIGVVEGRRKIRVGLGEVVVGLPVDADFRFRILLGFIR